MSIKAIVYTCANCGTEFRTDGPKDKIRNLALVDTTAADPTNRLCALFVEWPPAMVDRFVAGAETGDDFTMAALCPGCAEAVYRALSGRRSGPHMDLAEPEPRLPLNSEWTAAALEDYEAFRSRHEDAIACCTCDLGPEKSKHADRCDYLASVRKIDAAWYAQYKGDVL